MFFILRIRIACGWGVGDGALVAFSPSSPPCPGPCRHTWARRWHPPTPPRKRHHTQTHHWSSWSSTWGKKTKSGVIRNGEQQKHTCLKTSPTWLLHIHALVQIRHTHAVKGRNGSCSKQLSHRLNCHPYILQRQSLTPHHTAAQTELNPQFKHSTW